MIQESDFRVGKEKYYDSGCDSLWRSNTINFTFQSHLNFIVILNGLYNKHFRYAERWINKISILIRSRVFEISGKSKVYRIKDYIETVYDLSRFVLRLWQGRMLIRRSAHANLRVNPIQESSCRKGSVYSKGSKPITSLHSNRTSWNEIAICALHHVQYLHAHLCSRQVSCQTIF